jgi:hypothetical protein
MYRDSLLAADSQIEALRARLARTEADLADTRRDRARAVGELERIKEGVDPDPSLADEPRFVWVMRGLFVLASVASIGLALAVREVCVRWMPDPMLSAQGLRNFVWSVAHGKGVMTLAAVGFVALVGMPWVLLPVVGARGLGRQRRWGWTLAVAGCCLFLPTPLLPVAAFGLVVLLSQRVRRVFFAPVA